MDGEGQIWRCTSGYDQLYRSLAERWAWKVAQGTPGYFSALTDEDGPALLAGAEGDRPLPDPGAVEAAMEALTWTPVEPAPAEEPEGVTVTDASGYYRMTFCPGNLVYYYMDDYWNFWFQGTGEAELYPLLLGADGIDVKAPGGLGRPAFYLFVLFCLSAMRSTARTVRVSPSTVKRMLTPAKSRPYTRSGSCW